MEFWRDPSCVLYLPLYRKDGSSVMSEDHYGHLATVTGAIWTPQGRTCDGVDDKISVPDASSLKFGTGDFSVFIWVKTSQTAGGGVYPIFITKEDELVTRVGWTIYQEVTTNELQFEIRAVLNGGNLDTNTVINDGVWHFLALIRNGNTATGYIDLVSKGTINTTSSNTDKNGVPIDIGNRTGIASRASSGAFGEALVYSRALNLIEMQALYLATKRRYI